MLPLYLEKLKKKHLQMLLEKNRPMWPIGQRTRPPCAVERDALSGRGSRLSPDASAYQRIISNNSYARDEQGVNLRAGKRVRRCPL